MTKMSVMLMLFFILSRTGRTDGPPQNIHNTVEMCSKWVKWSDWLTVSQTSSTSDALVSEWEHLPD